MTCDVFICILVFGISAFSSVIYTTPIMSCFDMGGGSPAFFWHTFITKDDIEQLERYLTLVQYLSYHMYIHQ